MVAGREEGETVVSLVGNRIGIECLRTVFDHGPFLNHIVGVTPRGNMEAVRALAHTYSEVRATVSTAAEVLGMLDREDISPSWLLNLWGEVIISQSTLALCANSLNIHPSFLPWARGSDPIVWTILNGWPAGATLHVMTSVIDAGAIWAQVEVPYELWTPAHQLYGDVLEECQKLFAREWPRIFAGELHPHAQRLVGPPRRRSELLTHQTIDLDDPKNRGIVEFIRNLQAYDFGDNLSATLKINGKSLRASLSFSVDPPTPLGQSRI